MRMRLPSFRGNGALLSPAITLLFVPHAFAGQLLVYNINNTGAGSLRQAVSDNNVLGGGNTIIFSNIVTGTIMLTTGE
ncbi:MAG: hypothetical protein ACREIC_02480, partial [Limisphaerales bacterium]